jgi:GrpB-like predicted nucleotidyltransferase (UPF0157 family)
MAELLSDGEIKATGYEIEKTIIIVVVPYDPAWPELFREEAARVAAVFGDELLSIHHIGSTAVPGLAAKPIIDIMPVVRDVEQVDRLNEAMVALGYEPKGEFGLPGRRFFVRYNVEGQRTHHVHAYEPDNPEVVRHLDFRDYLIAHPEAAAQYAQLKQELAEQFRYEREQYTNSKTPFIKDIEQKARRWRNLAGSGE